MTLKRGKLRCTISDLQTMDPAGKVELRPDGSKVRLAKDDEIQFRRGEVSQLEVDYDQETGELRLRALTTVHVLLARELETRQVQPGRELSFFLKTKETALRTMTFGSDEIKTFEGQKRALGP